MLPPNMSLGRYITFSCCAMLSMFLGSQVVHSYYKPLLDLNKYLEAEIESLSDEDKQKIKKLMLEPS